MTISCNLGSFLWQPPLFIGFSLEHPVWCSDQIFRGIFLECGWVKYLPRWSLYNHYGTRDMVGGGHMYSTFTLANYFVYLSFGVDKSC